MGSISRRTFIARKALPTAVLGAAGWSASEVVGSPEAVMAAGTPDGTFDVKSYGATGAGNDDTQAFKDAVAAAAISPAHGGIVWVPPGRYKLTSSIEVPADISIEGTGGPSVIDLTSVPSTSFVAFSWKGSTGNSSDLDAPATEGAQSVTVKDSSVVGVGDFAMLSSGEITGSGQIPRGEIVRVVAKSGGEITFTAPISSPYGGSAPELRKIVLNSNGMLRGLTFDGPQASTIKVIGALFDRCVNPVVDSCTFRRIHHYGVSFVDCIAPKASGCDFVDALFEGLGYGIGFGNACQDGSVHGCSGRRLRHLVTCGGSSSRPGVARRITVAGNTATEMRDAGFDAHPGAEDIVFTGNVVQGSASSGIFFQAASGAVTGNRIRDVGRDGVQLQHLNSAPLNVVVSGNSMRNVRQTGISFHFYEAWAKIGRAVATGNVVDRAERLVSVANEAATSVLGFVITDNVGADISSHGIYLEAVRDSVVAGNAVGVVPVPTTGLSAIYLRGCLDVTVTGNSLNAPEPNPEMPTNGVRAGPFFAMASSGLVVNSNRGRGFRLGVLLESGTSKSVVVANNMHDNLTAYSLAGASAANNIP